MTDNIYCRVALLKPRIKKTAFLLALVTLSGFILGACGAPEAKGWTFECEKADPILLKIGEIKFGLPLSYASYARQAFFQPYHYRESWEPDREPLPNNAYCKDAGTGPMSVRRISFNGGHIIRKFNKTMPLGVTSLVIKKHTPGSEWLLGKDCTDYGDGAETCTLRWVVPDLQFRLRIMFHAKPYNTHGEAITSETWPYAYYPEEEWPELKFQTEKFVRSLIIK